MSQKDETLGFAGLLASKFGDSKLTPILVFASVMLGMAATFLLPREEEPQIVVPMIDVMVSMPGATPKEIEQRVTVPMEKLLWEIPDVEYVYSTSMPGSSMVIVRYTVGTEIENALVRLNQKLQANADRIPRGASAPIVKPRSIDDVPILALTFHGADYDGLRLRRLVAQVDAHVKQVPNVSETTIIGGLKREIRVIVDPIQLEAFGLSMVEMANRLRGANVRIASGSFIRVNEEILVESGSFIEDVAEIEGLVLNSNPTRPIYLRDVATVVDGPEDPGSYVFYTDRNRSNVEDAVTISVAKRPGANAIDVSREVIRRVEALKGELIPRELEVTVTRDYGETAKEKSDELLLHMGIAVFSVSILIAVFLGWRESIIVLIAIPATLGLTLAVFYFHGYTLNRITLFALIFSIGILVDDAIVVVENVARHTRMPESKRKPISKVIIESVAEVGNPTVLATWAVVAAILPMAFVGGLMGPYMRPIPVGATAAMLFSLLVAFIVTPWAAKRLMFWMRSREDVAHAHGDGEEDKLTRLYRSVMSPMLRHAGWRWLFLASIVALLLGSMALVGVGWVTVKMLPFDNKSEFQVMIDMPEGTPMEKTAAVALEMARVLEREPETKNVQVYVATSSPYNFNGLVRHYFLRNAPNQADLQVNLVPKHDRSLQSHDIAKRIRENIGEIARANGAVIAVAEVPPGPPVLQTLVAEVYGPDDEARNQLAAEVRKVFDSVDGVVDIDWYVEADQAKRSIVVDKAKAASHGLSSEAVSRFVSMALQGEDVTLLREDLEREDVVMRLEFPQSYRGDLNSILYLKIKDGNGKQVPLSELVSVEETVRNRNIYHKNLQPVTYVTGDVAGAIESPAYAIFKINAELDKIDVTRFGGEESGLQIFNINQPDNALKPSMKWDGEWHITLEVFRDLGLAFAAVCILIYMLMVGWFKSFMTPLIVMAAIPFSLIGILPAHGFMGAFFTATSMIGFMAGAGIVVRNSIILVDFIELRLRHGDDLEKAVVDAGAVRFRPMLLTALAVVVAAAVILADPIFQGLAIALMAGEIASLLISRMAVPVLYYMFRSRTAFAAN